MPRLRIPVLALIACLLPGGALAQSCGNDGSGFQAWLQNFKRVAAAQGISSAAVLDGVAYDTRVIRLDRTQRGTFNQSFESFSAKRITAARLAQARSRLGQYAGALSRIEQQFGVPREVVVAIWGLETDFGAGHGNMSILQSLATLAYDCRRSAFFTGQLLDALRIVQRGDIGPDRMIGGWAGEIGQTQFLPSSYVRFAVDFDGDGRRDLIASEVDVLASTANYLRGYGWRAGQPYGPGTANFQVIKEWNKSDVYARTIAAFAQRL